MCLPYSLLNNDSTALRRESLLSSSAPPWICDCVFIKPVQATMLIRVCHRYTEQIWCTYQTLLLTNIPKRNMVRMYHSLSKIEPLPLFHQRNDHPCVLIRTSNDNLSGLLHVRSTDYMHVYTWLSNNSQILNVQKRYTISCR